MNWYLHDTDYLLNPFGNKIPFQSKKEALETATSISCDNRKRPIVKRLERGLFEYEPPDHRTIWIVSEDNISTKRNNLINGIFKEYGIRIGD